MRNLKSRYYRMIQKQRERVSFDFRRKAFKVLVSTDVAVRGLHSDDITHAYNYDISWNIESYTNRVDSTALAGNRGKAISLVDNSEDKRFLNRSLLLIVVLSKRKRLMALSIPALVNY